MLTKAEHKDAQERAAIMIRSAGVRVKEAEIAAIEVVDFGISSER